MDNPLFGRRHYSKLIVLELQRRLQAMGYNPGEVNGRWSADTEAAIEQAQQKYGVSGGKTNAAYFVVIPGNREDLPKIAEQVILLGVPETGVYQRDSVFDPKVAVGPFFNPDVAKRWLRYLRDFGLREAQIYYGC